MDKPFQRKGSESNAHVGRDFETKIQEYFTLQKLPLTAGILVQIGINGTKNHSFDLGNEEKKILIECKAHKWTEGGNVPSAKLTVWNEAMFFFHAAPPSYRKILVVLKDFSSKRNETLGEYYIRTYSHLIPKGVEIWEYNEASNEAKQIK
ncbi:MAG: hypothetical protein GXY42_11125 [Desulfovibrionales bacterium]|nr:hypothetical protein [Desulfovibrionales bacterium]